jgi:hypothetical protein
MKKTSPCPDPTLERAQRLVQVRCEVCGDCFPAAPPVDDSRVGLTNKRDGLLLHFVESPHCDRRVVSAA